MSIQSLIVFACALASFSFAQVQVGHCNMVGTSNDPGITGTIEFKTNGALIDMIVNIQGITVNRNALHGIHIHQYGDLSSTDASETGSHWNPTNVSHGCPGSAVRHYGDTGNWTADVGVISATKSLNLISLTGTYSILGFAVILHSTTDDCVVVASSGTRLAQCVIGVANPTYYNSATVNTATPSNVSPYTGLRGVCYLQSTTGNTANGLVLFEPQSNGIRVRTQINGLVAGSIHGFHIHEWGDLRSTTAAATGSHWNPTNSTHGIPPFDPHHIGDMGNIVFYDTTTAYYEYTHTSFGLTGALWNIIGRGVILHASQDNCSAPVGAAGSRLAQCVIGYANPLTQFASWPVGVPVTQNTTSCETLYPPIGSTSPASTLAAVVYFVILAIVLGA